MAFGVLEPAGEHGAAVPGTVLLHAKDISQAPVDAQTDHLGSPLSLSRARKELYFLTLIVGACATGAIGPVLVPAFGLVAADLNVTLQKVSLLNGALIMTLGVGSYVLAVLTDVVGRRLVFVGTSVLLIISCVWAAVSSSYGSLLGARVLQGFAMSSFYSVGGTTCINDVFHVHERGRRAGLWNFAVMVANNFTPIVSGYIVTALNWRWTFWFLVISYAVVLVLVCLFFPETHVVPVYEGDATVTTMQARHSDNAATESELSNKGQGLRARSVLSLPGGSMETMKEELVPLWKKVLGIQGLRFGTFSDLSSGLVKPFALLVQPAAIWSCLLWSIIFTWVIILGTVADQIFAAPPYNMKPSEVGILIGVAPLIGSAIGTVFAGWSMDFAASVLSRRHTGLFEPEYRLLGMIPCLEGLSPLVCGVFLAFISFGVGCGCTSIVSYTNDVFMQRSGGVFGLAMLAKSSLAFGLTFMLNDFYAERGPLVFFCTWGALSTAGCLATIPMYVFGKRARACSSK